MSTLDNMRQYLSALSIPSEQKRYAMNFCKKMDYLNNLHNIAAQETGEYICTGYGNVNSKICFVFKDKDSYDVLKPLIQEILDKFHINLWDIYVTFLNKTKSEYSKKYSFLSNEIHAVGSELLYIFDKDDNIYKDIVSHFLVRNIPLPAKYFFVDIQKLASMDTEVRKELWNVFRYLINYKEIGQEE